MSAWCEERKEDWFCTDIGRWSLRTAAALASLLRWLVSTCVPPLLNTTRVDVQCYSSQVFRLPQREGDSQLYVPLCIRCSVIKTRIPESTHTTPQGSMSDNRLKNPRLPHGRGGKTQLQLGLNVTFHTSDTHRANLDHNHQHRRTFCAAAAASALLNCTNPRCCCRPSSSSTSMMKADSKPGWALDTQQQQDTQPRHQRQYISRNLAVFIGYLCWQGCSAHTRGVIISLWYYYYYYPLRAVDGIQGLMLLQQAKVSFGNGHWCSGVQ